MKRQLILFLALSGSLLTVLAQPSYTSADFAVQGDTFVISRVQNGLLALDVASTGANFTWNFDSLQIFDQEIRRIEDPDNTGYYLTWLAACILGQGNVFTCPGIWDDLTDQAILEFDTLGLGGIQLREAYTFYKKTGTTYEASIYGVKAGIGGISVPVAVNYEDIDTLYQFPVNYLDKDSSTSRLRFAVSNGGTGLTSIQQQKRVNEVDGWGSLTTPFATYDSVLRMKTLLANTDSLVLNGDTFSIPATTVEYKWFAPNVGQPVMTATASRTPLGEVLTSIEFVDSLRCLEPNANFLFFPPIATVDSASGKANVNFLNQSGSADQFTWDFRDGSISTNESPSHEFDPGLYLVRLIACNGRCTPLQCDTFSLPVTVVNTFAPLAIFNVAPSEICLGDSVGFTNNTINADSFVWDFGNGQSSLERAPTLQYAQADTYEVALIAINGRYRDTTSRQVIVHRLPQPDFGQDTLFLPSNFSQSISPGNFDSYLWSTGDTDPSIILNGQQLGIDTLIYWVDVMDENDCMQRDSLLVIVSQPTQVPAHVLEKVGIFPNPVSQRLNVSIPDRVGGNLTCRITDLQGKLKYSRKLKGGKTYAVEVDTWPLGFYLIHFEGQDFHLTQKFLIED